MNARKLLLGLQRDRLESSRDSCRDLTKNQDSRPGQDKAGPGGCSLCELLSHFIGGGACCRVQNAGNARP